MSPLKIRVVYPLRCMGLREPNNLRLVGWLVGYGVGVRHFPLHGSLGWPQLHRKVKVRQQRGPTSSRAQQPQRLLGAYMSMIPNAEGGVRSQ